MDGEEIDRKRKMKKRIVWCERRKETERTML